MNYGNNIKAIRIARGLSQADVASALGVSRNTVSSWEVGRTEPNMEMVSKLAKLFTCKTDDFITGNTAPSFDYVLSDQERTLIETLRTASDSERQSIQRAVTYALLMGKGNDNDNENTNRPRFYHVTYSDKS